MEIDQCTCQTKKEKILSLMCGLFLILGVILTVLLILKTSKSKSNLCLSRECYQAANRILRNMNSSVDPCENFYDYACGSYKSKNTISYCSSTDVMEEVNLEIKSEEIALIKKPYNKDQPRYYKLVKDYFASCENTSQLSVIGIKPLRSLVQKLDGWPLFEGESWNEENYDWTVTLNKLNELGLSNGLFYISTTSDDTSTFRNIIQISTIKTRMLNISNFDEYFEQPDLQKSFKLYVNVCVYLGADRNIAESDIREIFNFIFKLSQIQTVDSEPERMTLNKMQNIFPAVDWVKSLNSFGFPIILQRDENILVGCPECFVALAKLLSETKARIIANYLLSYGVGHLVQYLDEKTQNFMHSTLLEFHSFNYKSSLESRTIRCFHDIRSGLSLAIAAMFAHNEFHFSESIKTFYEIFYDMKRELSKDVSKIKWFDSENSQTASEKLKNLEENIGFPKKLLDDKFVNSYYSKITFLDNQYFENQMKLIKLRQEHYLSELTGRRDSSESISQYSSFFTYVYNINPLYNNEKNSIDFRGKFLRDPIFNTDWPNYLKYAATGVVIGNTLSSVITSEGSQYDANNKLRNWWTNKTSQNYDETVKCLDEQLKNWEMPYTKELIDYSDISSWNIDSVLGTLNAYKTYTNLQKRIKSESRLPGIDLNPRQLFWMYTANLLCEVEDKQQHLIERNKKFMPLTRFKVMAPIVNSLEFAEDFKCPINSNMNPEHKCAIFKT